MRGWGAQWKGVVADLACILVLHLLLETTLWSEGKLANILLGSFCLPQKFVLQFTALLYAICVDKCEFNELFVERCVPINGAEQGR